MEKEKKNLDQFDKYSSDIVSQNDIGFQAFLKGISLDTLTINSKLKTKVIPSILDEYIFVRRMYNKLWIYYIFL